MSTKAFEYSPIATDSNYAPLLLELLDAAGRPVNVTDATFTVIVKDEMTGEVFVQDGVATANSALPHIIEYVFDAQIVAKITREATWLVEWTITAANGRIHRMPVPCRLPVRPKL